MNITGFILVSLGIYAVAFVVLVVWDRWGR
jgi:hypothetical protein